MFYRQLTDKEKTPSYCLLELKYCILSEISQKIDKAISKIYPIIEKLNGLYFDMTAGELSRTGSEMFKIRKKVLEEQNDPCLTYPGTVFDYEKERTNKCQKP